MAYPFLTATAEGVQLDVHVQPRSSRSRLVGEHGGRLKVQLAAPPVDGEANRSLIELMARVLGVPRSQIAIASGQSGKRKLLRISGVSLMAAEQAIARALA
jgi:uncharacterized protein (TIGR00251 family)